jgi:DNA polymerase III subunit delta
MIIFIYGENNYQARQLLTQIIGDFTDKNAIERYRGDTLTSDQLPDILRGASLFSAHKLVVMSDVAGNKTVWADLAEHLESLPDELELVIFEETPDKRTKTYKLLQKVAKKHECQNLSHSEAAKWLGDEAKNRSIKLLPGMIQLIVNRAGLDQWQLHFALEKLATFDDITEELIENVIEASPQASAFELIDAALNHQSQKVQAMVEILRVSEDAYFFFGLLASQIFQLIALAASKKSSGQVAKDLGVHPYPLQKMQTQASKLTKKGQIEVAAIMADCDNQLKRSGVEPWLVLEQALLKLALKT